jgi:spore maturation protein CgeB
MNVVILGLSITSSWGNGHATNYRALTRALVERGHDVLFLERETPWYHDNRDLAVPPWGTTSLYESVRELRERFEPALRASDLVLVGSYVPEGVAVAEWALVTAGGAVAFWDIDTPVTVARLELREEEYLTRALVPRFDLYLSFTGGPLLERIVRDFGARRTSPFYCMADPDVHRPLDEDERWLLGYLGTYSPDRQPALESLLLEPARALTRDSFVVAGSSYPLPSWPANVERIEHLPPAEHAAFYARQRFTLNLTRAAMIRAGWSPSVRLFEAALCATPIVSDRWDGLDSFFRIGAEILVASSGAEVADVIGRTSGPEARSIGLAARARVLAEHTPDRRVDQLEALLRTPQAEAAAA